VLPSGSQETHRKPSLALPTDRVTLLVSASQICKARFRPTTAALLPSGCQDMPGSGWPSSRVPRLAPVIAFQEERAPLWPPVGRTGRPSGDHLTSEPSAGCPFNTRSGWPVRVSHSRTVTSYVPAEANVLPSGDQSRPLT